MRENGRPFTRTMRGKREATGLRDTLGPLSLARVHEKEISVSKDEAERREKKRKKESLVYYANPEDRPQPSIVCEK